MIEEILFGLTMIFVAYVMYEVVKVVKSSDEGHDTHIKPVQEQPTKPAAKVAAAPATATAAAAAKPASSRSRASKAAAAPAAVAPAAKPALAAAAAEEEKVITLRDPASGETSAVPSNYRFAKKWIKDAIVKEGLLPKVYKNSELKGDLNAQVKTALDKFKDIKKYQA